ncbi:hypothetical protein [Nocardia sp. IFM 10818]
MVLVTTTAPPSFHGDFEAHLTVRGDTAARIDAFENYAAAHDLKFVHIVLDRGRVAQQPMITVRHSGSFETVRDAVEQLAARLSGDGFPVVRTKIEATPWAEGVPLSDAEALGARYYFEHHVKLLLSPATDIAALTALAVTHSAHLSANARRTRPDGHAERFVTQRCRRVGDATAAAHLETLMSALRADAYEILSAEREFVVHDSDESIDDGWIAEGVRS